MEEDITRMFLQGITLNEFKLLYLVGISGFVLRFLWDFGNGVYREKFQWRKFIQGFSRVLAMLGLMVFVIARFQEFSHYFVSIDFTEPIELPIGVEPKAGITVGTALLIGLFLDDVTKRGMNKIRTRLTKKV